MWRHEINVCHRVHCVHLLYTVSGITCLSSFAASVLFLVKRQCDFRSSVSVFFPILCIRSTNQKLSLWILNCDEHMNWHTKKKYHTLNIWSALYTAIKSGAQTKTDKSGYSGNYASWSWDIIWSIAAILNVYVGTVKHSDRADICCCDRCKSLHPWAAWDTKSQLHYRTMMHLGSAWTFVETAVHAKTWE